MTLGLLYMLEYVPGQDKKHYTDTLILAVSHYKTLNYCNQDVSTPERARTSRLSNLLSEKNTQTL